MTTSSSPPSSENAPTTKANDELTPLLPASLTASNGEAGVETAPVEDQDPPLPLTQILLLCYTSLVEPVAFFTIFPYISFMIENSGGIAKEDVGFYAGLIESLFSATQMCVMIFWGKAADRFGRKPVLAFSLFGVGITTALFGLSQSILQMILFRCLAGVFAGTIVTVRAMLSENSTKKTQARVFSYFAFARNMGIFIGPMIGGALENPARKYKSTFGKVQFFHDYPYALPGFVAATVGLSAAIVTVLFIKETLHTHQDKKKSDEPALSTWELINYPGVRPILLIYNYVMLLAFSFTAAWPVFMYTPINLGGLELIPEWQAVAMGLGGAAQAAWLLFLFPWLHKRFGTGFVLRFCAAIWPVFFIVDPICNVLLRYDLKVVFWIVFSLNILFGTSVAMAFTAAQLAINDIAPSPETFGTLNALVLAISSGLRAIVPAASTSLFATGVKYHIFGGQLFWVYLIAVAGGLNVAARFLPASVAGRPKEEGESEGGRDA